MRFMQFVCVADICYLRVLIKKNGMIMSFQVKEINY